MPVPQPAARLAARLGIEPAELGYTSMGGNSPQSLVNATSLDILDGRLDIAILSGGEAWRTFMRAREAGVKLDWAKGESDADRCLGEELEMNLPAETERGIYMPVQVYPMFETAIRAAAGRTVDEHQRHLGKLWSDLSHVAADNAYAWIRDAKSPEEITTVTASNRMIGFPYPKSMNSNNDVDMGAAIIMCSVEAARRLGVPGIAGCSCTREPIATSTSSCRIATRSPETPAIELGGRPRSNWRASASTTSRSSTSTPASRPRCSSVPRRSASVSTGSGRARAAALRRRTVEQLRHARDRSVVDDLREQPGDTGWCGPTAVTRPSTRSACTRPTARPRVPPRGPQDEIDRLPRRELASPPTPRAGDDRGLHRHVLSRRRPGGAARVVSARRWPTGVGVVHRRRTAAAMCDGEWVGTTVTLTDDSTSTSTDAQTSQR